MSKARLVVVAALAATLPSCGDAPLTAPAGSSVFLLANPPFVVANGGVSVVTAVVTEPAGTFVPDGTEVFFFTDLGRIEASRQTKDGVARVNFVADSRSGVANVIAISGGPAPAPAASPSPGAGTGASATGDGSAAIQIAIGSARPALIVLSADRNSVTRSHPVTIIANVFDESGNPVANVPMIFTLSEGTGGEGLQSGGAQVFTNNNGQASDVLFTSSSAGATVVVTATAAGGSATAGTLSLDVNGGPATSS